MGGVSMSKYFAGFFALILFTALTSISYAAAADPYQALSVLRIRKTSAPDFSLPQVNGKTVRLSDYKGKIVLLGFFKTF